jgi:hypothetical protein
LLHLLALQQETLLRLVVAMVVAVVKQVRRIDRAALVVLVAVEVNTLVVFLVALEHLVKEMLVAVLLAAVVVQVLLV